MKGIQCSNFDQHMYIRCTLLSFSLSNVQEKMLHFWFNTFFIDMHIAQQQAWAAEEHRYILHIHTVAHTHTHTYYEIYTRENLLVPTHTQTYCIIQPCVVHRIASTYEILAIPAALATGNSALACEDQTKVWRKLVSMRGAKLAGLARHTRFVCTILGLSRRAMIRDLRKKILGWCESALCA